MFRCCLAVLILSTSTVAEDLLVLAGSHSDTPADVSLREHLLQTCFRELKVRREQFEQLETAEDIQQWARARREFFLKQLGPFPPRSEMNAQVVSTLTGDGYRVENILFESQPNHHVTGNLYLPTSSGPHPVVLIPCGHSYSGKAAEQYQRASILMARHGLAAFCYDPIGQGERYQTFAPDGTPLSANYNVNPNSIKRLAPIPGQPNFNPVEEHTLMGIGSILVGRNTATYRIFDGMRCLDYLTSRPDIDASRIGCTGNSGGGTLTAYLMALDERIRCGAPGCFMTSFERLLATKGPQDAEQNIFGQIAFGMDEADYIHMRAPQPTVILAATRDATFDITGTWDSFREAKRSYARFLLPEQVDLVEADEPHGFTSPLRVAAVRGMRRWLMNKHDPIIETDFPVWSAQDLQCTPRGQVMFLPGERSVFELNRQEAQRLRKLRDQRSSTELRQQVRTFTGSEFNAASPGLERKLLGTVPRAGYQINKLLLSAPDRVPLPALEFVPDQPNGNLCLYFHGSGKHVDADAGGAIERLVRTGQQVLAVDLAGIGETKETSTAARHWSTSLFGEDGEVFWLAYLLGKPLVGIRTDDILATARFAKSTYQLSPNAKVSIIAISDAAVPALHAMALDPSIADSLTLQDSLPSYQSVVDAPLGNDDLCKTIHGVLQHYDLPDLISLIGKERINVIHPAVQQETDDSRDPF